MVKFEFILSDEDAEYLIGLINSAKFDSLEQAQCLSMSPISELDKKTAKWYSSHAEYLDTLKEKILSGNSRIYT